MMNNDVIANIEYLREKADVSYEEAASLLEQFDGNVMRALVELERQGRVYQQSQEGEREEPVQRQGWAQGQEWQGHKKREEAKRQASGFISQAFKHRVVVESGTGEDKHVIANLSAPYCAGAAILAPWVAIGSVGLMFALGYRVKVKKVKTGPMPEDVETFVDKTVSNIKKAATNFTETVRSEINNAEKRGTDKDHDDDDDEGGEITIE